MKASLRLGVVLLLLFAGRGGMSQALPGAPPRAENAAQAVAEQARPLLRRPTIHGDMVAFNCEGDLWVGDLKTGQATRLTSSGQTSGPLFSPDGKQIAFAAAYDGVWETYLIPTDGGAPRRLTYLNRYANPRAWAADGKSLFIQAPSPQGKTATLYRVAEKGGFPEPLPLETVSHASGAPDGARIVFTRIPRADAPWFRYEGGKKNDIWIGDVQRNTYRKVYSARYTCEYPVWVGERIAFVADEGGAFSVLSTRPDGSDLKRLAGPFNQEIRSLNSDGKRLIYERAFGLEICDPDAHKTTAVSFHLHSDLVHTRPGLVPATRQVVDAQIGPTGKRVLVETRGQIVTLPVKEGEARVLLAKEGVRYRAAAFAPNAKQIAYLSDETGEQQLYVADADGGHPRALTTDIKRQLKTLAWSPDSRYVALTDSEKRLRLIEVQSGKNTLIDKGLRYDDGWDGPQACFSPDTRWIVYSRSNNTLGLDQIVLYEIATGTHTVVSTGAAADYAPTFSPDGKWIAFLSRRNLAARDDALLNQLSTESPAKAYLLALQKETLPPFLPKEEEESAAGETPKPDAKPADPVKTVIDLEGLAYRFVEIPVSPAYYNHIAVAGDRVLLSTVKPENLSEDNPPIVVMYYDLKAKKAGTLAENVLKFQVSADGKKLLLSNGALLRVGDTTAEHIGENDGKLDFANLQLAINPSAEWRNEYWDAWRLIRDYFYVANMHGVDWQVVGQKYAALLPSVRSRDELNELIRWLLAELSVSHAGVYGGAPLTAGPPASPRPSYLGIDVALDASGYYRITRILHAKASPGVREFADAFRFKKDRES